MMTHSDSSRVARLLLCLFCTVICAHATGNEASDRLEDIAESADLQSYRQAVERSESDHGAYDNNLAEQLLGLGLELQRQDRHAEAVEVFKRGVHVARINSGLYSQQQIPLLRGQISSHIALGQLTEADERQHNLYRVQIRSLGAGEQRAQALMQQAGWQLDAYRAGVGNPGFSRLMNMWDLYRLALTDMAARDGETSPQLLEPLYGMLRAQYLIAGYDVGEAGAGMAGENDYLNRQEYNRFNAYRARSFSKGSAVIRAIYEIEQQKPEPDPARSAAVLVQLGDWYMLHGEQEQAFATYREALGELVGLETAEEEAMRLLGEPAALPSLRGVRPLPEGVPIENANVILEFSVTDRGRVVNLERVDDTEGISGKVNRLMRQVRQTPFRPRFQDGEPAGTAKVVRAYVVDS